MLCKVKRPLRALQEVGKRAEPLPPTYRVSFVTSLHLALARPCAQVKMGLHFGSFPEGHERAAKMGLHPATASHRSGSLAGGPTAAPHQSASPLGLPPLLFPLSFLPALVPALPEGEFWGNSTDLEFRESEDPINHWVLLQTARRLQHRGTPDWPMGCRGTPAAQVPFLIVGHWPGTHKTLPKEQAVRKIRICEGKAREGSEFLLGCAGRGLQCTNSIRSHLSIPVTLKRVAKKIHFLHPE